MINNQLFNDYYEFVLILSLKLFKVVIMKIKSSYLIKYTLNVKINIL